MTTRKSKSLSNNSGTFIVDDEINEDEIDFDSMLPCDEKKENQSETDIYGSQGEDEILSGSLDTLEINGKRFQGRLRVCKVIADIITGKTIVRVILEEC